MRSPVRSPFYISMLAIAAMIASPVLADSNASGGGIVNSQTVSLGAGPYDHGGAIGSLDNTVVGGINFTGGFSATHIRFTGTLTSVNPLTWGSEADIQIRQGSSSYDWLGPGPAAEFTKFDYDSSQELMGDFAGGIDPGAGGNWDVEFFESFDDGAGVDSQSTNVNMIFEERAAVTDTDGSFSLGVLNGGDSASSVGEFALPSLFDLYSITLNQAGLFSFLTDQDPTGFVGADVDTEIAIFDATGVLIAEDDDSGNGLYSRILDLLLAPGDYTLAVTSYLDGTSFADGPVVNPGTGTGDYSLSASLVALVAVPVPGTFALFGLGGFGLLAFRRRKHDS